MDEAYTLIDAFNQLSVVNSSQNVWWNVYIISILAILGFIASDYAKRQSKQMHLMLIIGFFLFASANAWEIYLIQRRINIISE